MGGVITTTSNPAQAKGGGGGGLTAQQAAEVQTRVDQAVDALIAGAPGALDTLNELAASLGDDANAIATLNTAIAARVPLTQRGAANGVATLDGSGKVPAAQLSTSVASNELLPRLRYPQHLRRWRAALADAQFALAKIVCLGDSITLGAYANNVFTSDDAVWAARGWVSQYRALLAAFYGDVGEGAIKLTEDVRVTFSGGSGSSTTGPLQTGRQIGAGNTITVALPACTDIDVVYWNQGGAFTWEVDGGGATTVTPTGTDIMSLAAITGLADATHSLVLTGTGTAHVGFVVAKRGTTGVRVHRLGRSGATTETATMASGSAANRNRMLAATFATGVDLAVIMFGANDIPNQGTNNITPSVFRANLKLLTDKVTALGGCSLLLAGPRYPNPSAPSTEADYYAQALDLAATDDHVAFADLAEVWGTEPDAETLGLMNYATYGIHPVRKGHGDIARIVYGLTTGRLVGVA